jgi:uncharacterized protein YndB with AHSA1/START domain
VIPEAIWDAITKPEFTERYFHADPAFVSGLARFQVFPMPGAIGASAQAA